MIPELRLIVLLLALGLPTQAVAQRVGDSGLDDAVRGLGYALDHCAECHAVRRGKTKSPRPDAPAFEAIAKTPGMTGRALAVWLRGTSHPTMPNIIIPPDEVDHLISYILGLRKPQWWRR